jgi:flagellar basal body-associated protein FliL
MRIVIVLIVVAAAVALALVFLLSGAEPPTSKVDDAHKAAAIQVARCDAAMSTLDAELGSGNAPAALATRIQLCTKAKVALERARAGKPSTQLDVSFERVTKHLARLNAGSATGSN